MQKLRYLNDMDRLSFPIVHSEGKTATQQEVDDKVRGLNNDTR